MNNTAYMNYSCSEIELACRKRNKKKQEKIKHDQEAVKKHSELLTHRVPITTQESGIRFVIYDEHHIGFGYLCK